jgi:hypothetical protein
LELLPCAVWFIKVILKGGGRLRRGSERLSKLFHAHQYRVCQTRLEEKTAGHLKNILGIKIGEEIDGEATLKAIEAPHGFF